MAYVAGSGGPFEHAALWAQVVVMRELAAERNAHAHETVQAAREMAVQGFTRESLVRFRARVQEAVTELSRRRR
jgi:hypothetical protein